ncbi:hypothetical protein FHG87_007379 [Trinorchestia longiramus]|nr:hypothetical protein FHG87_007379 [Trinorchestia longiramus]
MWVHYYTFILEVTALVIGFSGEIPAKTFQENTAQACHVYALTHNGSPYSTPSYVLTSPSFHVSSLTSLLDHQVNKIDMDIQVTLSNSRLVQIYLKEDVVTILLDGKMASGNLHGRRFRRASIFSIMPRWFWQKSSSESTETTSLKVYKNGTNEFSPSKERQAETILPLRWWSISIHFTEHFIFARLDGTSATVVAKSSSEIYNSFPASVRVSSSHRTAVMFDCAHGCPIFTSILDNLFFPLTHTSPVAVVFLCVEDDFKNKATLRMTTQTARCSESSSLHKQAAGEKYFRFSLSPEAKSDAQCVTVTLSRTPDGAQAYGNATEGDQDGEVPPVCKQLVIQRTTSLHPNVTKFELRIGRTRNHVVRLSVVTQARSGLGNPALTVADATEGAEAKEPVVFLHPLDFSGLTASFDCPSKQFIALLDSSLEDGSSSDHAPEKGWTSRGVLWSVLVLISLIAVLIVLLSIFIMTNIKNRWKDFSTELDGLSMPETVSVISGRSYQQYNGSKAFLHPTSLTNNTLMELHNDMVATPSTVRNLRHQREAEEVSEPGSPAAPRSGAREAHPPLDFEELYVSTLPLLDIRSFNTGSITRDKCRAFSD